MDYSSPIIYREVIKSKVDKKIKEKLITPINSNLS